MTFINQNNSPENASSSATSSAAPLAFAALLLAPLVSAASAPPKPGEPIELDPLTVVSTGTRTERLASEVPIRTEMIRQELFRSAAARDLSAALEYLPGIRSEANCQNCGTAEVKILGLGAGYNQLLFDGQPLFSGLASVYGIEQVPTAFIDRIEVVKGGASALYGPGAVAGVVNILPREPVTARQQYESSFERIAGASATSQTVLRDWASENGDLALTLYGQLNDSGAVDLNGDGFSEISAKRFHTIGANGLLYPTENGKLAFNYSHSGEQRRGGDASHLQPHESQITEQLQHSWHRGGIAWQNRFDSGASYRISASLSHVARHSYYGGVGAVPLPGQTGYDAETYAAALQQSRLLYGYSDTTRYFIDSLYSHRIGQHDLSWGAQYQIDQVFDEKRDDAGQSLRSDGSVAEFSGQDPIVRGDFDNLGFFVQDEWAPTRSTALVAGLRLDKHSELDDWALSPRIAARHAAGDAWTWRASVSTGFRAPELFDEDLHIEILEDPTRTRNAAGLKKERAISYAIGFAWNPATETRRLKIEGNLFRTALADTFNVSPAVQIDPQGNAYKERRNAGGARVQGFELNASYRLSTRLSAEFGASYVDSRFDAPQEVLDGVFETRFLESPAWTGVAQLAYENEAFADLFLGLVYTGPMIALKEVEGTLNPSTPSFLVLDLTASKHLHLSIRGKERHIDLTLGVKNLLDARQKDLGFGPERDASYFYGPRFPRSYVASAALSW